VVYDVKCKQREAPMTKPILEPMHPSVPENSHFADGAVIEVRNITLKEALEIVRALHNAARSEEVPSSTKP